MFFLIPCWITSSVLKLNTRIHSSCVEPASLQDSDNPDLRDRGYIYWRLLSTDPVTAKEVVLSEKPLISEETDLIEPTLLDELICHIGSLASVYHKPPSAFVEGSHGIHRKHLPVQHSRSDIVHAVTATVLKVESLSFSWTLLVINSLK